MTNQLKPKAKARVLYAAVGSYAEDRRRRADAVALYRFKLYSAKERPNGEAYRAVAFCGIASCEKGLDARLLAAKALLEGANAVMPPSVYTGTIFVLCYVEDSHNLGDRELERGEHTTYLVQTSKGEYPVVIL